MNLERQVLKMLYDALQDLVKSNVEWNSAAEKIIGKQPGWSDSYLDAARAALTAATLFLKEK